jgi:hypothetical protein
MTALAHLILAFLATHVGPLWIVYAPHIRRAPEARAQELADQLTDAAQVSGVDVALLTALAAKESAFNHDAVSSVGARGMMQLLPASRYGRAWSRDCARDPDTCETSNVRHGAWALRDGLRECGPILRSLNWYRSGRCTDAPRAREVVRLAARIRRTLEAYD